MVRVNPPIRLDHKNISVHGLKEGDKLKHTHDEEVKTLTDYEASILNYRIRCGETGWVLLGRMK